MSLFDKFLPKKEEKEYFLTVGVEENRINATVSLIVGKEVTIIGTGQSEFSETSEETEAADIAISEAEKKIGEDILVQKVVFGLPLSLLEDDKIKPQHLARLKKIAKTLSLVPSGFIEYSQALAYYLETKEESPPTLFLMFIGKHQITFSHVRVGKIEKTVIIEKSSSVTTDFEKTLSDFSSSEILPSRIMLYDESGKANLEEIKEELVTFPWHKHSSFLHTPKIETLEVQALTYALVEAAAKSLAHEIQLEEKETPELPPIEEKKKIEEPVPQEDLPQEELVTEETFGFVKDKDIKEEIKKEEIQKEESPPEEKEEERVQMEVEVQETPINPYQSVLSKIPKFNFPIPQLPSFRSPIIVWIIGVILILLLILFAFWYFPKAILNLIVYPASNSSQIDVLFTTSAETTKPAKNAILATAISEEISGDKTTITSGTTKIGEKAIGSVTVYNKTQTSKIFPKGTVLLSDNLKFTLNDDVTIASASDTGEGLTFGKITASITAVDIGPESNLVGGTNFYFKDFDKSSYYAKNNDKLSGGTSRDITSVSKNDQDKLMADLVQDLTSKVKQQMMQKLGPGEKLLDVSLSSTATSKKFSKNVGEESKELSLSLTLKVNGLIYKENDLTDLTHENSAQIPSGYSPTQDKTRIKVDEAKINKNGDILGKATITYYFFPQIETGVIKSAVSGKTFTDVDKYLSTIQNIGGAEIIVDTKLPLFTNRLPYRPENININLVSR